MAGWGLTLGSCDGEAIAHLKKVLADVAPAWTVDDVVICEELGVVKGISKLAVQRLTVSLRHLEPGGWRLHETLCRVALSYMTGHTRLEWPVQRPFHTASRWKVSSGKDEYLDLGSLGDVPLVSRSAGQKMKFRDNPLPGWLPGGADLVVAVVEAPWKRDVGHLLETCGEQEQFVASVNQGHLSKAWARQKNNKVPSNIRDLLAKKRACHGLSLNQMGADLITTLSVVPGAVEALGVAGVNVDDEDRLRWTTRRAVLELGLVCDVIFALMCPKDNHMAYSQDKTTWGWADRKMLEIHFHASWEGQRISYLWNVVELAGSVFSEPDALLKELDRLAELQATIGMEPRGCYLTSASMSDHAADTTLPALAVEERRKEEWTAMREAAKTEAVREHRERTEQVREESERAGESPEQLEEKISALIDRDEIRLQLRYDEIGDFEPTVVVNCGDHKVTLMGTGAWAAIDKVLQAWGEKLNLSGFYETNQKTGKKENVPLNVMFNVCRRYGANPLKGRFAGYAQHLQASGQLTGQQCGQHYAYAKGTNTLTKFEIHKAAKNRYLSVNMMVMRMNHWDMTAEKGPVHHLELLKQFHNKHINYVLHHKKESLGLYDKIIQAQLEYPLLTLTYNVVDEYSRNILFSLWAMMHGPEKGKDTNKFVQMLEWTKAKLGELLEDDAALADFMSGSTTLHDLYKAGGAGDGVGARAVKTAVQKVLFERTAAPGFTPNTRPVQSAASTPVPPPPPPPDELEGGGVNDLDLDDELPVDDNDFNAFMEQNAPAPASSRGMGVGDRGGAGDQHSKEVAEISEEDKKQIRLELQKACVSAGLKCLDKHGAARTLDNNAIILEPNDFKKKSTKQCRLTRDGTRRVSLTWRVTLDPA